MEDKEKLMRERQSLMYQQVLKDYEKFGLQLNKVAFAFLVIAIITALFGINESWYVICLTSGWLLRAAFFPYNPS